MWTAKSRRPAISVPKNAKLPVISTCLMERQMSEKRNEKQSVIYQKRIGVIMLPMPNRNAKGQKKGIGQIQRVPEKTTDTNARKGDLNMLVITVEVDIPGGMEFAVKEDLAYVLEERYGRTVRVVSVEARDDK